MIIDNRQYERCLKKDKHHSVMLSKKQKEKDHRQSYYESQSIKINVIQRKFYLTFERKPQNKLQRDKDCYTCEKLKHFSRKYTQNKYKNKFSSYDKNNRIIAVTKIVQQDEHNRLLWTACYDNSCYTHLNNKEGLKWFSKSLRRIKFLAATHRQSDVHDENNEKKFFIIISKKNENREDDRDSTVNALNKTIFEVNYLKDTIQQFVEATEYKLQSESFIFNIKEEIQRIIKQTSFINMYSKMYDLFRQKKKDFSQRMQQIKNSIHQTIYESKSKESVLQRQRQLINYWNIVKEWSSTNFKFIKQERYVLSDEDHILRKLRKMIEAIRERFDKCDSKKYSYRKINSEDF